MTNEKHNLYKDGNSNIPEVILDRNGQVVLNLCKDCGKAEKELNEPCNAKERPLICNNCKSFLTKDTKKCPKCGSTTLTKTHPSNSKYIINRNNHD